MKNAFVYSVLASLIAINTAYSAAPVQARRGGGTAAGAATKTASAPVVSARAATNVRGNKPGVAPSTVSSARSATVSARAAKPAAGATPQKTGGPVISARAGTTQKVVSTGTKVSAAAQNIVVSEECKNKYNGCMDSFCMIDNTTGGRCVCSDKNAEFDAILAEIDRLDQQSYQMATTGLERMQMGDDANEAIAKANAIAKEFETKNKTNQVATKKKRSTLDLSLWNTNLDDDFDFDTEIQSQQSVVASLEGKEGDALYNAVNGICVAQMPECSKETSLLQLMYQTQIKADCSAYSNTLSQRKTASAQKLQAAQRALREEALEQIQNANKYDLGQCVIEFSKCMQTTAGCGADYTACTSMSVMDNVNFQKSTSAGVKNYQIKGAITNIEITASTYDALMSKKPLCETVTKQCTRVAGQVWDTFLQNVAPQLKSAELIAEDNARQNCIGTISDCFKKACKDNMDPNDPDGSYDMCLSRPETMLNVCKIPLNNCGIDSSSAANAQKSNVWGFVVARLASMRVDSCTTEVKQCLISDDRCGTDYLNCIGLDTDTIIRMCPYDKLVGCQKVYGDTDITGDKVYEELSTMVQGLMLNIDNNMLTQCQKAANDAMIKVCGDTENCNGLTVEENMGARSLEYRICEYSNNDGKAEIAYNSCRNDVSQITDGELGRVDGMVGNAQTTLGPITPLAGVLDGTIYWESLKVNDDGRLSSVEEYLATINETSATSDQKHRLSSEISMLQSNIDSAINAIESDPTVQFCMTGREVQGMKINNERKNIGGTGADNARFPELTKQMRLIIANAALKKAKDNYYKKYDELNAKMLQDYAKIGERIAEIQGENSKDARRELGRQACIAFADASALPKSPNPPKNVMGKILVVTAVAVASVFTAGAAAGVAAGVAAGATAGVAATAGAGASMAVGGAISATAGLAATAGSVAVATGLGIAASGSNNANGSDGKFKLDLIGSKQVNQWNYKESITSTYDWETLNCHRCIRSQKCSTTKNPLFGKKYCKKWAESVENCTDTQF